MSLVSVVLAVCEPDLGSLDTAISSVAAQRHPRWELCVVDDASTRSGVGALLRSWARRDARIRLVAREQRGGLAATCTQALTLARGDVVTVVDATDVLHPDAVGALNHVFTAWPDTDVAYTDEAHLNDAAGGHPVAVRKPGWSPRHLEGRMYLGHLVAYRTDLVRAVGGFRPDIPGCEEWDLALRATEVAREVRHLPRVLCNRRAAVTGPRPETLTAARRVLAEHASRVHGGGSVEDSSHPGWFHLRRPLPTWPRVTVVMPTGGAVRPGGAGGELLAARCLAGLLEQTDHEGLEICVVISANAPESVQPRLAARFGDQITTVRLTGPFNYARSINAGVSRTAGDVLVLLNDDIEVLHPDWLRRLLEMAGDPAVGVTGVKLVYPDGRIQHAGVTHDSRAMPHHPHARTSDDDRNLGEVLLDMDYLAVTGACQVVRREVFERVGGYDPALPMNYNDIDFCLKVGATGQAVVQVNSARLCHLESATRPLQPESDVERALFLGRWRAHVSPDPFHRAGQLGCPAC